MNKKKKETESELQYGHLSSFFPSFHFLSVFHYIFLSAKTFLECVFSHCLYRGIICRSNTNWALLVIPEALGKLQGLQNATKVAAAVKTKPVLKEENKEKQRERAVNIPLVMVKPRREEISALSPFG